MLELEDLLSSFKYAKFVEKFSKRLDRKEELLEKFALRITKVDWAEFAEILEPQNEYEEALNLHYKLKYATCQSYELEDSTDVKQ